MSVSQSTQKSERDAILGWDACGTFFASINWANQTRPPHREPSMLSTLEEYYVLADGSVIQPGGPVKTLQYQGMKTLLEDFKWE